MQYQQYYDSKQIDVGTTTIGLICDVHRKLTIFALSLNHPNIKDRNESVEKGSKSLATFKFQRDRHYHPAAI